MSARAAGLLGFYLVSSVISYSYLPYMVTGSPVFGRSLRFPAPFLASGGGGDAAVVGGAAAAGGGVGATAVDRAGGNSGSDRAAEVKVKESGRSGSGTSSQPSDVAFCLIFLYVV